MLLTLNYCPDITPTVRIKICLIISRDHERLILNATNPNSNVAKELCSCLAIMVFSADSKTYCLWIGGLLFGSKPGQIILHTPV